MTEDTLTLAVFYKGWYDYQALLTKTIAPLTSEYLALSAAPGLRSISTIVCHIIAGRARWFHDMLGVGDEEFELGLFRCDCPDEKQEGLPGRWLLCYTHWKLGDRG